jgi:hypothetical protein
MGPGRKQGDVGQMVKLEVLEDKSRDLVYSRRTAGNKVVFIENLLRDRF